MCGRLHVVLRSASASASEQPRLHGVLTVPSPSSTTASLIVNMHLNVLQPAKRRKRSTALVEDDVEAADAITHEKVTKISRSGTTKSKTIVVPLIPVVEQLEHISGASVHQDVPGDYQMPDHEERSPPQKGKVGRITDLNARNILMVPG